MNLTDEQKQIIAQRLSEGATIADIQRLVTDEFGVAITYMDTRFLMDDLNLDLKPEEPKPETPAPDADTAMPDPTASLDSAAPGSVSVDVDKLKHPGAAVSGSVTFSDGVSAKWYVDTMGRLGLDPMEDGYQPSQEDIEAFQVELQSKMQGPGV